MSRLRLLRACGWMTLAGGLATLGALYAAESRSPELFRTVFIANVPILVALATVWTALSTGFPPASPSPRWGQDLLALGLLTALGALMRTLCWQTFPPADGQLLEETQTAFNAYRGINGGFLDPMFPLTQLIAEPGIRTLGPTMTGVRIPFVVLGVLSVPVFYVAARLFLRTRLAAVTVGLLFATNAMLAGSSRIALETMHPIFTEAAALAATFYAGRRLRLSSFAFAGVLNGLLFPEYDSYRLVPLLGLAFLLPQVLPRTGRARSAGFTIACFAVYLASAVVVEIPLALTDVHNPLQHFTGAYKRHQAWLAEHRNLEPWEQQVRGEFDKLQENAGYLFLNGRTAFDVLPGTLGLFDPYTGVLGLAALLYGVATAQRDPRRAFPALSIVSFLLLGTVLVGNTGRYRLIPVIPYYLLGIGVLLDAVIGRRSSRLGLAVAILLFGGVLAGINAYRFFAVAIYHRAVQEGFYDLNMVLSEEIARLQAIDHTATIVVISDHEHLARVNDYSFRYDYQTVKVVGSPDEVRGLRGYLLAHDQFIPAPGSVAGLSDCRRWTTKFERNVLVSCRLDEVAAPISNGGS